MPLRKLSPGQQYTATELNELVAMVRGPADVTATGDITVSRDNHAITIVDGANETILGRITGGPVGSRYPFTEVLRNSDDTHTVVSSWPGRFGTATDTPAIEMSGREDVPTGAIVELKWINNLRGWGFTWGANGIITSNVNGSQESTTTRLEFDQATHIHVTAGATAADPDIVALDVEGLKSEVTDAVVEELVFDVSAEFVECVSLNVEKTFSGGYLTDVNITLKVRKRSVTMLHGTTVGGTQDCVTNPDDCCPDPIEVACTPSSVSKNLTLTFSGGTGDCGCLHGSYPITYDAGNSRWTTGALTVCGNEYSGDAFWVACEGGSWIYGGDGRPDGTYTLTLDSADPFILSADGVPITGGACTGTIDVTVTE